MALAGKCTLTCVNARRDRAKHRRLHARVGRPLLDELLYKPSTAVYMQNLTSNKAVGHQQHDCLRDFLSQAHSFYREFVFRPLSRFAAVFS